MAGDRLKLNTDLNVPLVVRVRYVTVYPNDPTKNNGKGYGSSVAMSGTALINGEWVEASWYAKGKTWAALRALKDAGVIPDYDKAWDDPAERVTVPVVADQKAVTMCYEKKHGDQYATFKVTPGGSASGPAPTTKPKTDHALGEIPGDPLESYQPAHSPKDDANALVKTYRDLYESNARWMDKLGKDLEFPIDGASINAVTFSMFSTLRDRRLV